MNKKLDTILTILGIIIASIFLVAIVNGFCATVTDSNNGNAGYILVNDGTAHKGVWTDPSFLKGVKGDKGDIGLTGATGQQGIQGLQGFKGDTGQNGLNGFNGLNGIDGIDGINGIDGAKGEQGLQGLQGIIGLNGADGKDVDPLIVTNLQNTDTLIQNNVNTETTQRKNEDTTLNNRINDTNSRIDDVSNRVSKLEETQFVLETSFRILDTKRITLRPFLRQNFTRNKVDVVGLKIDVKLGLSYEEKLISKVNARLDRIEQVIGNAPIIERVVDNKGKVKSISIIGNGLRVNGEF